MQGRTGGSWKKIQRIWALGPGRRERAGKGVYFRQDFSKPMEAGKRWVLVGNQRRRGPS